MWCPKREENSKDLLTKTLNEKVLSDKIETINEEIQKPK